MSDTLFSLDARKLIDELVVCPTQRIATDYWIVLNGHRFNAIDVRDTLIETCEGSYSYVSDERMVEALKKLGVIEHGGSYRHSMSALAGPNYQYFMDWLKLEIQTRHHTPSRAY
jgi:hypothetical protein